jgi:hypothetical protein
VADAGADATGDRRPNVVSSIAATATLRAPTGRIPIPTVSESPSGSSSI